MNCVSIETQQQLLVSLVRLGSRYSDLGHNLTLSMIPQVLFSEPMGRAPLIFLLIALCFLCLVVAHEEEEGDTSHSANSPDNSITTAPPNFFRHPHHAGLIYSHIATMIAAWVLALPICVMLSISKSRYGYRFHHLFRILNCSGVVTGHIYKFLTPNLYDHHVHGLLGWIVTTASVIWTISWIAQSTCSGTGQRQSKTARRFRFGKMLPLPRWLRPENNTRNEENPPTKLYQDCNRCDSGFEEECLLVDSSTDHYKRRSKKYIPSFVTWTCIILGRVILLLGFAACVSGFVIYSGNFRGLEVYGGLSHWIKGGIFFWLGLLSLGRWIGAFADFGWAWNIKPCYTCHSTSRWKEKVPTLEFLESFLIWSYGASNIFLEHLSNWGGEWSATDFEHISITLLFIGGGFLGMVVESPRVQQLMDHGLGAQASQGEDTVEANPGAQTSPLQQRQKLSLNPLPSLTIMLLGLMMSSHHQHTALGSKIHAQWGYLFSGSALARITTLIMLYHKSPSYHPARPLTEIITSFCLTAGGILFMMSGRDSIAGLEANNIVAMTAFTATMGLAAVVLGWEVVVFAIKGWAELKERSATHL